MPKPILLDFLVPVAGAGGVERIVSTVACYLNRNGFHIRIVQLTSDGNRWFDSELEVYPILINKKAHDMDELSLLYATFLSQYGVPDIVIATTWPYLIMTARKALAASNSPCKVISWLHGPLWEYDRYGAGGIECMRQADYHLCISQKAANILIQDNPNVSLSVTYNPVSMDRFNPVTAYHKESRTLQFVGRLSPEKHIEDILEAIHLINTTHPEQTWKLKIIGAGEMCAKLMSIVQELNIAEYVSFLGWQSNPWEDCHDVTATILASEYEGSPLCAIESLANGIPVLSTPVDGITELINPGVNGWLFPIHDSQALADILEYIATNKLPDISPASCISSVSAYEAETALAAFKNALHDAMDTISVIIPCYNAEPYIRRCLDSIINQSISGVNIECICVDDHSTDNTLNILLEYEQNYPENFIIIPLDNNMKQGYARNIALEYASGDFITYVDADDFLHTDMLEILYRYAKLYKCDVTECDFSEFRNELEVPDAAASGNISLYDMSKINDKRSYIINRYWKTAPWGRLYTSSLLKNNNISFAENTYMEDILFSAECMAYMKSYMFIPVKYYNYFLNPNGTMRGKDIRQYYLNIVTVQNMATDFLLSHNWISDCIEEYSYAHYCKVFEDIVLSMCTDFSLYSYDVITRLKKDLLERFPDICHNKYLLSGTTAIRSICISILTHDLSREELDNVFSLQE